MVRNKIAFKLTLSFVGIVLISMLAIGVLFMQLFKQYTFESREKTMLTSAQSIAGVAADFIQTNDPSKPNSSNAPNGQMRGFGGYIRSLDTLTESKVWITDNKGNLTVISGMVQGQGMGSGKGVGYGAKQGQGQGQGRGMGPGMGQGFLSNTDPLPKEAETVIQDVLKGQESISESFSSFYNEATITVGVPILDSNQQIIGAVLLHSPVTGVTTALTKAVSILGLSLLGALLLAVALGIFYSLLFARPLKAMNRTAQEIMKGNYAARTGVQRNDELGQLGNSLDLLAAELGSTINQLFQEKGKLKDIISSISEGIIAFDTDHRPVSVNLALSKIMNKPISYRMEDIAEDLITLEIEPQLAQVMETKKPSQILKDWLDKKLIFTISPIADNLGRVTGSVALVQDISESERLEQLRRDFVANVSHEFRTPLTVIRGYLEAMTDGTVETSEEIKRYNERMLSETRSLERLVKDLLELSRLQSGNITLDREPLHFPSLLVDTTKSLQGLAEKKDIQLDYRIRQEIPPFLGDYDRLRQIIIIFLDNSITYSPNNTRVCLETCLLDNRILLLEIRDEGYGIAADQLEHIWDRFYKGDQSRNSKGTGLGLAIAKVLIELHGGKAEIQSELGKGTVVTIKLPIELIQSGR